MSVSCNDLERILRDADPADLAALEQHAASCPTCAEELRAWQTISAAAHELRDHWPSPALWPRIEASLAAEAQRRGQPSRRWSWLTEWTRPSLSWQTAAAAVLLVLLSAVAARMFIHRPAQPVADKTPSLITDEKLREVVRAETVYEQAINKLEVEAKPQLESPATPLLANYREKLLVLDSAIDELRAVTRKNPGNAHLRRQLLAMYQEKQSTLEDILEEKR